jgi:hypothetical protein
VTTTVSTNRSGSGVAAGRHAANKILKIEPRLKSNSHFRFVLILHFLHGMKFFYSGFSSDFECLCIPTSFLDCPIFLPRGLILGFGNSLLPCYPDV